jgi:putative ABC transport system substrate-binding protein
MICVGQGAARADSGDTRRILNRFTRRDLVLNFGRWTAAAASLALLGGCELVRRTPSAGASVRRIGYILANDRTSEAPAMAAFLDRLKQLGWVEGQNLIVEWREIFTNSALAPAAIRDLIQLRVDLIVVENTETIRAVALATTQIPVVMIDTGTLDNGVINPATAGYTASLPRPGGNITGTFVPEPIAKRMELLKTVFPNLVRVGMLHPPVDGSPAERGVLDAEAAARTLGMEPVHMTVYDSGASLDAAFRLAAASNVEAFAETSPWLAISGRRVVMLALQAKLPGMFPRRAYVTGGGLMSYSYNTDAVINRTADYADRILRGADPGSLPIQLPTDVEFVVNATTASALGITFPPDAAVQVTEWVQ